MKTDRKVEIQKKKYEKNGRKVKQRKKWQKRK